MPPSRSRSLIHPSLWLAVLGVAGCSNNARPPDLVEHYPGGGYELQLHVFQPDRPPPHPTILFFHGGAWQRGGPEQFHPQCRELADSGYLCVSAAYRVAETHASTPADALADAHAAFGQLQALSDKFGVDQQRMVVAGGSAGGHLAAMLGTGSAGSHPAVPAAALVLFNPMLNLEPGRPDHHYVADHWQQLSPQHQLRERLPPTLILLGDRDPEVPLGTAQAFCERARELGGDCELDIARGQGHGFFNRWYSRWQFYRTLFEMRRFLTDRGLAP